MAHKPRLCREILNDYFGPIVQQVARVLLWKGRLPLGAIVHFSKLTAKQVRESLVVLIQHNLVFYGEATEKSKLIIFYEIDSEAVLMRLRIPAILGWTNVWCGKEGLTIIMHILRNGKSTLKNLEEELAGDRKNKPRIPLIKSTFAKMVLERFLTISNPTDSIAMADKILLEQNKILETESKGILPDSMAMKHAKGVTKETIENRAYAAKYNGSAIAGMKRKLSDDDDFSMVSYKRQVVDTHAEVNEEAYFRVNFDKYNIKFRNMIIADFAGERINRSATGIIKTMLDYTEDKMKHPREEVSPSITVLQLTHTLPADVSASLATDIAYDASLHGSEPSIPTLLHEFIDILISDQVHFLGKEDDRGSGAYVVNFGKIIDALRQRILDGVVQEKFGGASKRLMKIMIENGKMDEKQIQKVAMLSAKDTREKLTPLAIHGFLDLQEVPRTADRAPARTFFLWHVNLQKCYNILIGDMYRTLGNIYQRKRAEMDSRKRLLEKTERSDVRRNLELLGETDRMQLEQLNKVLERLECSAIRLDDVVMCLRDFVKDENPRLDEKKR